MIQMSGFLREGFGAVSAAVAEAAARVNLHLAPGTITRTAALRLRASLALTERMVRRLLVLLSFEVELAPLAERTPAPARERMRMPSARGFAYFKAERYNAGFLDTCANRAEHPRPRPIKIAPLLHRWRTLTALLEDPSRAARHMARRLDRLRRAGEPKPWCWPETRRDRMPYALALIAGILPQKVNAALAGWYDSG